MLACFILHTSEEENKEEGKKEKNRGEGERKRERSVFPSHFAFYLNCRSIQFCDENTNKILKAVECDSKGLDG